MIFNTSIWIPCEWRIYRMETLLLSAIWSDFHIYKIWDPPFLWETGLLMHVAKYSTNPRSEGMNEFSRSGLFYWGQHHMKPLALPFVGLWMEYGWKVSLASLVNRPWLVFSLVPTAIELRYLYSWNKTDLHEDHIFFLIRSDISTLRFNYIWGK